MTAAPTTTSTAKTASTARPATAMGTEVDWSVLDIDGLVGVAERAARKVYRQFGRQLAATIEYDDLYQDALLTLATQHHEIRQCTADPQLGFGIVYHRLTRHLFDTVKTEAKRRKKTRSYDELIANSAATLTARTAA